MDDNAPFRVRTSDDRIALRGEFNLTAIAAFEAATSELDGQAVVVDLGGLTFVDSSGIRALVEARRAHAGLRFENPSVVVRRVLEIVALTETLLES